MVNCEPGKRAAAQRKNAALERSPGIRASMPRKRWPPRIRDFVSFALDLCAEMPAAPIPRDRASASVPRCGFRRRPAIRQTTGKSLPARWLPASCNRSFSLAPVMRSGGRPFCDMICAPIAVSGVITRSMGRRESDSSPAISLENFCPATMPLNMRMVEPEFPQSSGWVGAVSASPLACTSMTLSTLSAPSLRSHFTPSERRQPSVLAQSAPVE